MIIIAEMIPVDPIYREQHEKATPLSKQWQEIEIWRKKNGVFDWIGLD